MTLGNGILVKEQLLLHIFASIAIVMQGNTKIKSRILLGDVQQATGNMKVLEHSCIQAKLVTALGKSANHAMRNPNLYCL